MPMWGRGRLLLTLLLMATLSLSATASPDQHQLSDWTDCPGAKDFVGTRDGLAECVANSGATASETIRFQLGDSNEAVQARSSMPLDFGLTGGFFFTDTPVNLVWLFQGSEFQFENVGGTGQSVLVLSRSAKGDGLGMVTFNWQNRPLNLPETLERAKRLEAWLSHTGFLPTQIDGQARRAFAAPADGSPDARVYADDWISAEAMLSNEDDFIERMFLFGGEMAGVEIFVSAKNDRRAAWNFGGREKKPFPPTRVRRSIYDGTGGYEWSLEIHIGSVWTP